MTAHVMTAKLDELFADLIRKKKAEKDANLARIAAEGALIACLVDTPERGTERLEGTHVRAGITFSLNYKADVEAIRKLGGMDLPLKHVPESYELDKKAYEALREKDPVAFSKVAAFVTTTPAKPSVELKV